MRSWNGSSWIVVTQVIDGNLLVTGTVSATSFVAASFSAYTITGAILQTATSGQRVVINASSNNKLQVYSASALLVEVGGTSAGAIYADSSAADHAIKGFQTGGYSAIYGQNATSSSVAAVAGYNTSSGFGVSGLSTGGKGVWGGSTSNGYGGYFTSDGSSPGLYSENYYSGHGARIRGGTGGSMTTSGLIGLSDGTGRCFYNETGTFGPFTGSHDAFVEKAFQFVPGDIVSRVACLAKNGVSDTVFLVELSSQPNQKNACGVATLKVVCDNFSPPAAFIDNESTALMIRSEMGNGAPVPSIEWSTVKDTYDFLGMNALGEGQIKMGIS